MTLRPASYIYTQFAIPRNLLRQLAGRDADGNLTDDHPAIHSEERKAPDGINRMFVYSVEDCERYVNGEIKF